ncbi:MAG TPA: hypothetical protein VHM70_30220 [Polyangiaceae bacterium]|jgi:hypothetical protein|nr:hypothetical protein [Polyangiaceae bacterium]
MQSNRVRRTSHALGGLWRTATAISALLLTFACGSEFDSISQLEGLRVMAVQKDHPYAKPGEKVELQMLYHDTGVRKAGQAEGPARPVSIVWLSGCVNPPSDLYALCLQFYRQAFSAAGVDGSLSDLNAAQAGQLLMVAQRLGIGFGQGDKFELTVPHDIISSHPPSNDPKQPPYGLNYVFFAACAGELRFDSKGDFPVACYDAQGKQLGARDFIAGYTGVYSYESIGNDNPVILGLDVAGKAVPAERLCIGTACEPLPSDPKRKCAADDPVVKRCKDPDNTGSCAKLALKVKVDPKSVEPDGTLTLRQGSLVQEQMWSNFHTDRGKFTHDVALVNDTTTGFNKKPETDYLAPSVAGPAQIWAVVRDNRAGVQWARTQVCVKD